MYGYIAGIADTDEINFCPYCGEEITVMHAGGTVTCSSCKRRFGVVNWTQRKYRDLTEGKMKAVAKYPGSK